MLPSILIDLVKGKPFCFRIKIEEQEMSERWSKWLISPSPSYFESEQGGPISFRNIEWIEIKTVKSKSNFTKAVEDEIENLIKGLKLHKITFEMQDASVKVFIL